jgi:methyltransferase (TIGR00027 family)
MMESQASLTAIGAAKMRAAHLLLDEDPKIFRDDFALRFSGSDSEASLREDTSTMLAEVADKVGPEVAQRIFQATRALMISRSRYTEDALSRAIEAGIARYVILGAGLDSFAWRQPQMATAVDVFEIDHPASQQWKLRRLQDLGIDQPRNLTFLPIDFENQTLLNGLRDGGYPMEKPAFLSWLGVTQYLTREAVLSTFRQVATLASGTEISFTFVLPQTLLAGDDQRFLAMAAAAAAARGEPWLTFFDPAELTLQLQELGFARVEHFSSGDANIRYFADRSDGLRVPDGEHVMLAHVE